MKPVVKPRSKPRKRKRFRAAARLLRICAWLAALGVFWCGYLLWTINSYSPPNPLPKADAAIVLGAALWDNEPSPGLQERLDHALKLYKQGTVSNLILTGGLDHNGSTLTEAEGMRDYLLAKGVPADRMVLENDARSTYENLLFSKPIAQRNGWESLIIVTHDYHAPRSADIAEFIGYKDTVTSGFKSKVLSSAYNESREVLAFTKWKLDAFLMLIGIRSPNSF
ncbi:YdcF family protein [Paenibacillus spongiae]|uniref:YdcF family protein n=1 Tax=Paenibacillus spongiae TaxID=2909671 RepID=A0ABY5S210_9BACL|nr:YdcF family protein [Paenibacillus spongiae]UVI27694.1 YdcF family protein [Paenibacillus spongiae]